MQMPTVEPVVYPGFGIVVSFRLSDFIVVVRELKIDSS